MHCAPTLVAPGRQRRLACRSSETRYIYARLILIAPRRALNRRMRALSRRRRRVAGTCVLDVPLGRAPGGGARASGILYLAMHRAQGAAGSSLGRKRRRHIRHYLQTQQRRLRMSGESGFYPEAVRPLWLRSWARWVGVCPRQYRIVP